MASRRLENYLKTYRKRAGLSQDEVAFLLGTKSGTKVSRYERLGREPSLHTAWGYEALFGTPARDLFAGAFEKVEAKVRKRAAVLARKVEKHAADRTAERKLELLRVISCRARSAPAKET